jgi:hypothetical protein
VVGAEEQLTAAGQLDAHVRLGTAAVAPIEGGELWAWCDCGVHVLPLIVLVDRL